MTGAEPSIPPHLVVGAAAPPPVASEAFTGAFTEHGRLAHRPAATQTRFADDQTTPRFSVPVRQAPPAPREHLAPPPYRQALPVHPNVINSNTPAPAPSSTRQQPATRPGLDSEPTQRLVRTPRPPAAPLATPPAEPVQPTMPVTRADRAAREPVAEFVPDRVPVPVRDRFAVAARAVTVPQVVCWQVAVVVVALALGRPLATAVTLGLAAAVILAATLVRVHDRWLYQLAWVWARFVLRHRTHPLGDGTALGTSLLGLLLPGMSLRTVAAPEPTEDTGDTDIPALAVSHRGGVCALLRPLDITPAVLTTLARPAGLLPAVDGARAVQTVFHTGTRAGATPRVWLGVHAERTVAGPYDGELTVALRNALRRVRRALHRAEVPTEALTESTALAAFAALAHVTGGRNELSEGWSMVHTGPIAQVCFALPGWDALSVADSVRLAAVVRTGGAGTALTLTLTARTAAGPAQPRVTALLRLAANSPAAIDNVVARLAPLLSPAGVRITRLDGMHTSALAASLPIGGFLS